MGTAAAVTSNRALKLWENTGTGTQRFVQTHSGPLLYVVYTLC